MCRFLCLLALALPALLCGQQYRFETYQQEQGLDDLSVLDLAFDKSGFLWVATENGVYRFLGDHFEHYGLEQGLSERHADKVYVDSGGRIWVTTEDNIYVWAEGRFSRLSNTHHINVTQIAELAPNRVLISTFQDLLDVAVGENGALRWSKAIFTAQDKKKYPELRQIKAVAVASDGALWLACNQHICSYNNGELRMWGPTQGVELGTRWQNCYFDHRGSLWVADKDIILELPRGARRFIDHSRGKRHPGWIFPFSPILEDRQGRILVGSGDGPGRWDGIRWQPVGSGNGLTTTRILSMTLDTNGDLWLGTATGLTHWVGYDQWEGWNEQAGLPDYIVRSVNTSAADANQVLIGTAKGPAVIDLQQRRAFPLVSRNQWTYGQVEGIVPDKLGNYWIVTFGGSILRMDSRTRRVALIKDLDRQVVRFFAQTDGSFWVVTAWEIYIIEHPESNPTVRELTTLAAF